MLIRNRSLSIFLADSFSSPHLSFAKPRVFRRAHCSMPVEPHRHAHTDSPRYSPSPLRHLRRRLFRRIADSLAAALFVATPFFLLTELVGQAATLTVEPGSLHLLERGEQLPATAREAGRGGEELEALCE